MDNDTYTQNQLHNPKLEKESRLKNFLKGIPQLHNPKDRHYKFLSYDYIQEEEPLYEFWRDIVHELIGNVFQHTYATPDQIIKCFQIDGCKPKGLPNILNEMKLRKEFIPKQQILDQSYYSEESWLSSQFSKVMSFFSSNTTEDINMSEELVSTVWLEDACESIVDWALKQDQQVFEIKSIEKLLRNSGKNKDDIEIIIIHLRNTQRMTGDQ